MSGKLDYWRADNMWAAFGRPDGDLGQETISLQPGQKRVFVTDWKYEKKRNDGTNYYGSHGRRPWRAPASGLRRQQRSTRAFRLGKGLRPCGDDPGRFEYALEVPRAPGVAARLHSWNASAPASV